MNSNTAVAIRSLNSGEPAFRHAADIRRRVFVDEQGVSEADEWDGLDGAARHLLLEMGGEPAATLRYLHEDGWIHIGRVAVLPRFRSFGLGRAIMEYCLAEAEREGAARFYLNSQADKAGFYEKLGFAVSGGEFTDAGIPHVRMERAASHGDSG